MRYLSLVSIVMNSQHFFPRMNHLSKVGMVGGWRQVRMDVGHCCKSKVINFLFLLRCWASLVHYWKFGRCMHKSHVIASIIWRNLLLKKQGSWGNCWAKEKPLRSCQGNSFQHGPYLLSSMHIRLFSCHNHNLLCFGFLILHSLSWFIGCISHANFLPFCSFCLSAARSFAKPGIPWRNSLSWHHSFVHNINAQLPVLYILLQACS